MSDFAGLYDIRDCKESDKNFILATFLRGLYYGDSWFSEIPKDIFMANYKRIAFVLVNSPKVLIKIACLPEDPDVILGYCMLSADGTVVHWAYVKAAWRRKGIGRSLLSNNHISIASHLSSLGRELIKKYNITFNPFAL